MGVDTHLYLNHRWSLEDVVTVINTQIFPEKPVGAKPSRHNASFGTLTGRDNWFAYYHLDVQTPIGPAMMISARYSIPTVRSFKQIAETLGGALEEQDCDGKIEFINGNLLDDDGLAYFLKNAVLHGHSGKADMQGIMALIDSINEWQEKYSKDREQIPQIK